MLSTVGSQPFARACGPRLLPLACALCVLYLRRHSRRASATVPPLRRYRSTVRYATHVATFAQFTNSIAAGHLPLVCSPRTNALVGLDPTATGSLSPVWFIITKAALAVAYLLLLSTRLHRDTHRSVRVLVLWISPSYALCSLLYLALNADIPSS